MEVEFRAGTLSRPSIEGIAIVRAYRERSRARKAGFAKYQVKPFCGFDALLATVPEAVHDRALAASHLGHVDGDRTVVDAVVGRTPVYVGCLRAGDHRLGGGTALVDAGAADVLAFAQGRPAARPGERLGARDSGLACPDHHGVVMLCSHRGRLLSLGTCSRRALMDVCLGYPGLPESYRCVLLRGALTPAAERLIEVVGCADEGEVCEGLREVAQCLAAVADLLGVEPEVVCVTEHMLEDKAGFLEPPRPR